MKALIYTHHISLLHLGMRSLALAARFCLSLFMVKYLTLDAIGFFGVVIGVINIVPRAIGFGGLPYFFMRDVVGLSNFDAARLLRDWLAFTIILLTLGFIVFLGAMEAGLVPIVPDLAMILTIVFLETIAFDLNIALVALKMPLLANTIVFMRTASWVAPFIVTSYLIPPLRSLSFLMEMWCIGLLLSYLILFWQLRSWRWQAIFRARVTWHRLWTRIASGTLVYLSDLSLVGSMFLNRFILVSMTNLEQVGVFVFYWTFSNAVLYLVHTSTLQIAQPYLMESYHKHKKLFNDLKRLGIRSGGLALVLAAIAFGTASGIVILMDRVQLQGQSELFGLMLVAMIIQIFVEILSYGLYARRQDKAWAWSNIFDVIISAATTSLGILCFGLDGVAYAMVLTALFAVGCRWYFLTKFRFPSKDI